MNHDICCIGVARMQDPHSNLNVNRGIPTRIRFKLVLSQKGQNKK